ncbi:hypothetical protein [Olsenella urininfantis]|uniref:hypothetical protein n=1 Tax=Olsenella urininfantis TaxID=1871033 RepID=UPI0009843017|nr:hypothetical protein [Olsenella urininfantis]
MRRDNWREPNKPFEGPLWWEDVESSGPTSKGGSPRRRRGCLVQLLAAVVWLAAICLLLVAVRTLLGL